jgi:hypothetical protein
MKNNDSPNSVISAESDPVGNRLILLLLDSKGSLRAEGLVGRLTNME